MAPSKNQVHIKMKRQMTVADLYLKAWPMAKIAAQCGVSTTTIHKDLKEIRQQWLDSKIEAFDEQKALELAKIDKVESEAWEAWYRSCKDRTEHRKKVEKGPLIQPPKKDEEKSKGRGRWGKVDKALEDLGTPATMVTIKEVIDTFVVGQVGDPRFLTVIQTCVDQRCKIQGLFKEETKTNVNVNNGVQVVIPSWDLLAADPNAAPDEDPVEGKIKALEAKAGIGEQVPDAEFTTKKEQ